MGDPWNGLIIGAQCVSQRMLAGGQVGTGVLPEELEEAAPPPAEEGCSKQPLQDFWNHCNILVFGAVLLSSSFICL